MADVKLHSVKDRNGEKSNADPQLAETEAHCRRDYPLRLQTNRKGYKD